MTHTKQLLLVTLKLLQEFELFFGHTDARTDGRMEGQTDVEVEIVI